MHKKRIRTIITRVLEAVVLFLGVGLILLQTPWVQTRLADKVMKAAGSHIDGEIHFSAIKFAPFTTLIIKDFVIIDSNPRNELDTLMSASHVSATFSLKGLLSKKGGMQLDRVRAKDFTFNLVIFDEDENGVDNNIASVFRIPKGDGSLQEMPDLFCIKRADIDNFHYRMVIMDDKDDYEYPGHGIDWRDLDLVANAKGHDINFKDGGCDFAVDWLRIKEKCGYSCLVSGHGNVYMGVTTVTDARIIDKWSNVSIKKYTMACRNMSDFSDFLNKMKLSIDATATPLSLNSVSYFCGIFKDSPILLDIDGLQAEGPIADFHIGKAKFTDRHSGIKADLTLNVDDIFTPDSAYVYLDSRKLEFTSESIGKLVSGLVPEVRLDLGQYAPGVTADIHGVVEGPLNDLQTELTLDSEIGAIRLAAALKDLVKEQTAPKYEGELALDKVDLSKAGLGEGLGRTSLELKSKGTLEKDNPHIVVDRLDVSQLTFNDYTFSRIDGNGYFKDNTFTGNVRCNDPNLNFIFGGSFSLSAKSSNSIYKFNLLLGYADLAALNIDKKSPTSTVSAMMNINFRKTDGGVLIGDATISKLTYADGDGKHNIGDILFASVMEQDKIRMNLRSAFADFSYAGDPDLSTLADPILASTAGISVPALLTYSPRWDGRYFDASFYVKDTKEALSFLHKDIKIAPGTQGYVRLKKDSTLVAQFSSKGIKVNKSILKGLEGSVNSSKGVTQARVSVHGASHDKLSAQNATLSINAGNNTALTTLKVGRLLDKDISMDINLSTIFSREENGDIHVENEIESSNVMINGQRWSFSQPQITYRPKNLTIRDFLLSNGKQQIMISGGVSGTTPSTLALKLKDIDLSTANIFLSSDMPLSGSLDGFVYLSSPSSTNAGLKAELLCPDLGIGRARAGNIHLTAHLDDEDDLFKFTLTNGISEKDYAIKMDGSYNALSNYLNARLSLNSFNPNVIQPALTGMCFLLDGAVDGKVNASGPLDHISVQSNGLSLTNLRVGLVPTGVTYTLNGRMRYEQENLIVDRIDIRDGKKGSATLSGKVPDLTLRLDGLSVLDKNSGSSDYYGTLALDGNIRLSGPDMSNLLLDADIANSGTGKINVAISAGVQNSGGLLQFKEPEEEQEETDEFSISTIHEVGTSHSKLEAKCRMTVNPGLSIVAALDKEGSNALSISGDGVITADANTTTGNISLGGNYNITEGKYHFATLSSLISKDFNIENGSSLTFAGDVLDTELNINARHSLKTSLGPLISDTTSVSTRRLVNCNLKISDKLRNPSLGFSIDIPDLDPSTKSLVESELNTEDKVSRQFLALVVLGGFLPGTQSSIVNNSNSSSNFIYSNLASIMSGQLNAVLQKLNIPLDLGLSYQQNEVGNDVMDVAVSTQLFDNMVSVNGSVGNRKFSSTSDENVVGDLDINVKLNKDGRFRLNIFSHSADDYTNYLDNSQRNGIGVSYQKEYDSLRSYLRRLFKKEEEEKDVEIVPNKTLVIKNE